MQWNIVLNLPDLINCTENMQHAFNQVFKSLLWPEIGKVCGYQHHIFATHKGKFDHTYFCLVLIHVAN